MEILGIIFAIFMIIGIVTFVIKVIQFLFFVCVFVIGAIVGIFHGPFYSFIMAGIWYKAAVRDFKHALPNASKGREKAVSNLVNKINLEREQLTEAGSCVDQGFYCGSSILFAIVSFILHIFFTAVYLIAYLICCTVILVLSVAAGTAAGFIHAPVFYVSAFILRKVFSTISAIIKMMSEHSKGKYIYTMKFNNRLLPVQGIVLYSFFSLSGTLFGCLLIAVHTCLFLIVFPPFLICFITVRLIEDAYMGINGIFTICPSCFEKMRVPCYKCPNCGEIHKDAWPHFTHILYKRCTCGHLLPVSLISDRSRGKAVCTGCGTPLEVREMAPVCIPIIGGPSVGKTCFTLSVFNEYMGRYSLENGIKVKFALDNSQMLYSSLIKDMSRGILPAKTVVAKPFDMSIIEVKEGLKPNRMICLYDIAGEVYSSSLQMSDYNYFNYSHGFVFIIDPLSIPGVAQKYMKKGASDSAGASMASLADTFDVMLIYLEKHYGIRPKEAVKQPCAVVINKVDALNLDDVLGDEAIDRYMEESKWKKGSREQATHLLCRKFLEDCGETNFIEKLEYKFKKYRFFPCSSISIMQGEDPKGANTAIKPVLWLMNYPPLQK